jgi:hypothetical protein
LGGYQQAQPVPQALDLLMLFEEHRDQYGFKRRDIDLVDDGRI